MEIKHITHSMEIKHYATAHSGSFELENDGEIIAEITYKRSDNELIINHTGVDTAYRGQKLGEKLVAEAVNFARRENFKITPLCSYAKALIERNPDYSDVLK
jgi:predicted GNAT family acetyltransferase